MSGWVLVIIVLLLAIPFALFGINNYFQAQVDTYVAKVNDVEIAPRGVAGTTGSAAASVSADAGSGRRSALSTAPTASAGYWTR